MFPQERYAFICKKLEENHSVTVSQLMKDLDISIETVRRDLFFLERQGRLKRVHGGAIPVPFTKAQKFPVLQSRLIENQQRKSELSKKALAFIEENDIISIDSGSTAVYFAQALKEKFKALTIVTYSLDVVRILSDCEGYKMILPGGMYLDKEKAMYGALATQTLRELFVQKAFVFPSALSLEHGIQDFSYEIVELQKLLLQNGSNVFILADSSKFEKTANLTLSQMNTQYTIVTDNHLNENIKKLYAENDMKVI